MSRALDPTNEEYFVRTGTSNYIPQILYDVITLPCTWYLLLEQYSPNDVAYKASPWKKTYKRGDTSWNITP